MTDTTTVLDPKIQKDLERAAKIIKEADALLITTGAGMGVDSGLPDFRGPQGFWRAYPPMQKLGLQFSQMSNPQWFDKDPDFAWGFWTHRYKLYTTTDPHVGYHVLKQWGESKKCGYFSFTSNVDTHFRKAGYPADRLLECHGTVKYLQCHGKCQGSWDATGHYDHMTVDEATFRVPKPHPQCPACKGPARPNVLMFGDWGWDSTDNDVQDKNYGNWIDQIKGKKLAIIEIGAGTGVPTIRHQSEYMAQKLGATLIRVNLRDTDIPAGDHIVLPLGGKDAILKIDELMKNM